ncbi:biotin transporter BioY [Brevibacillus migulae]|uniref:biotin transporter BioY n=1 Tax=Brevibacillus migulae TaxID=1644114 RepID=UPI00196A8521|nr:biotin transporter BioY [Brevibacillus migulae]
MQTRLRGLILSALFAAITAILAQVTIPLPLVPITGQTLAVGLAATILGSRLGTLSMLFYALLGAIGIPVFSEAAGGFQVILGPTGGYIIGFIVTAFVIGLIIEKTRFTFTNAMIANIIGMVVTLAIGVVQLKFVTGMTWDAALAAGVYPFIVGGIVKAVIAAYIGIIVRKRLAQAKLLPAPVQSLK